MNRFSRVLCFRCARVVLALLAASVLMLCAAGCSPDSSPSPFHEMVPRITGLRFEGEHRMEVTDARAVELFRECLLKAEDVPHPAQDVTRIAHVVTMRVGNEWETQQCEFIYRHLPFGHPLYVRWGDKWYRVPGDFEGMVGNVRIYRPDSYAVDAGDEYFLQTYV